MTRDPDQSPEIQLRLAFSWPLVDRYGGLSEVKLKVYQISANLIHRELRNATFEGKKFATSIKRPDSDVD